MHHLLRNTAATLFDLDNTLFDRDRAFRAWAATFARTQLDLHDDHAQTAALQQIIALDAHGHCPKATLFAAIKQAFPALSSAVPELVGSFQQDLLTYCTLDAGTTRLLDTLDAERIPFGIVTNGSHFQLRKIQALGLDARTSCIFVSEIFGARKPDPAIFLAAAARLGHPPEQILFVGDTPEADIVGAHRAGMRALWLQHGRPWPAQLPIVPDHTITALSELLLEPVIHPSETGLDHSN